MFVESEFGHDCIIIPQKPSGDLFTSFCWILKSDRILGSESSSKTWKNAPDVWSFGVTRNESCLDLPSLSQMFFWPVTSSPLPHDQGSSGCVGCWPGKTHDGKKHTQNFLTRKNTNTMQEKWQIFWHYSREKKNNPFQITLRVGSWIQKNTSLPPRAGYLGASKQLRKNKHIKMVSLDTSWFISIWPVFSLKGETESIPCKENISALRKSKVSSGMTTSFTSAEFEGTSHQALGCPGKKETALVELSSVSSSSLSSYLHHNDALLIFIDFSCKQVLSTWSQHTTPTLTPAKNTHFRKSAAKEKREKYHLGQCALSHDAQKFSR